MNEVTEQIEKIPYYKSTVFARIKDAVDDIHKRTSGTMPLAQGFCSINKNDLYRKTALALREENIIENLGTRDEPKYIWKSAIKLTESVYHRVYLRIRQYNRKYYDNKKMKGIQKESPVTSAVATLKDPLPYSAPSASDTSTACLEDFSSQQLWDELKARGFGFVDGKLSKTIYLN